MLHTNCGVLTAANADYWDCLPFLVLSVQDQGGKIAVVDDGLTEKQLDWLKAREVLLFPGKECPEEWRVAKDGPEMRRIPVTAWLKPYRCQQTPFDVTLWIDADAICTRGLAELFARASVRPLLTTDILNIEYSTNAALCVAAGYEACRVVVNAGVLGWSRAYSQLIDDWAETTLRVLHDGRLFKLCTCCDQDTLLLTALREPLWAACVEYDPRYNYPANGLLGEDAAQRKAYALGPNTLKEVREDHPQAFVVHWPWRPKIGGRKPKIAKTPDWMWDGRVV